MEAEPPKADPPKRNRRWYQFSLRSLMIFTLICAVCAGWLGKKIHQKRREREAVHAIVKAGGDAWYDQQRPNKRSGRSEPSGPRWLRNLLGENFFREVKEIDLYQGN